MVNDSSSSRELLAKSNPPVSLVDHSASVATTTESLLDSPVIVDRVNNSDPPTDLSRDAICDLGQFAGRLHDVGKAHPEWQAACIEAVEMNKNNIQFPSHSARSALYAFAAARERGLPILRGVAVTLAILHHHTPMTGSRMQTQWIRHSIDNVDALIEMSETLPVTQFPAAEIDRQTRDSFLAVVDKYHSLDPREDDYRAVGTLTTVLRAALVQADHHASAKAGGGQASLPTRLTIEDVSLFETLRPFQQQIQTTHDDRLIGLAGCGEGKTHSALQWGNKMISNGQANRLVFAMPTQVTTNNLLLSITGNASDNESGHIPSDRAALYHSASESFYESDSAEQWDLSDASLDHRARRWFQQPVTVTTVDHVLSTLVNGYNWASLARGNLLQSAVVFDELHAYDEHTTGHILGAISALDRAGVPWYVMSATIPPQIRTHRAIDGATTIQSTGRLTDATPPREPFTVRVEAETLDSETVLSQAEQSDARRIMVVRNTVAAARELATDLRNAGKDVVYYSSSFTQDHRELKENEIRRRFGGDYDADGSREFLVCTQVCEISLDLSADLLLTDIAPIDALIQRAGRLHRSGVVPEAAECHRIRQGDCQQCAVLPSTHKYECVVYAPLDDHDRWLPYAEATDTVDWELLERTKDVLQEANRYRFDRSLGWVDDVYKGLPITYDWTEFSQASRADWLYGDARQVAPDADRGDEDLTIRQISKYKRAMFMQQYEDPDGSTWSPTERWHQEHDCPRRGNCGVHSDETTPCDHEFWKFATRYTVDIPQWWLQTDDHPVDVVGQVAAIEGTEIASIDYSYTLGAAP